LSEPGANKQQETNTTKVQPTKRVLITEYLILFVLFLIMFTMRATVIILQVFVPSISQDFLISSADLAVIFTIYAMTAAVISFFVGPFIKKLGYQMTMGLERVMAVAQSLAGVGSALFGPAAIAFSGDHFKEDKRASVIGFIMSSFYIATILAVPINAYIGELLTWHWAIGLMAILSGIVFLGIILFIPRKKTEEQTNQSPGKGSDEFEKLNYFQKMKTVLSQRDSLGTFIITLFQRGGLFAMTAILSDWLLIKFNKDALFTGLVLMGAGIAAFISNTFFSWLADKKVGRRTIILFGTALTGIWIGVFALLAVNLWLAIFGVITLNFLGGIAMGSYNAHVASVVPKAKSITVALNNTFGQISQALIVAIIVKVIYKYTQNYSYAGFAAAAFYAIALILMLVFIQKNKKTDSKTT